MRERDISHVVCEQDDGGRCSPCNLTTWSERRALLTSTSCVYRSIGHSPSTGSDSSPILRRNTHTHHIYISTFSYHTVVQSFVKIHLQVCSSHLYTVLTSGLSKCTRQNAWSQTSHQFFNSHTFSWSEFNSCFIRYMEVKTPGSLNPLKSPVEARAAANDHFWVKYSHYCIRAL